MSFNGTEGTIISLNDAAELTANYRRANPSSIKAFFFGKEKLKDLLDQTDCMGIRIYFGLDEDEKPKLVLVGAESNEDDILDLILDYGEPCPSRCGSSNDLNS